MRKTIPSIQTLFEDQVERRPDSVAVVFEEHALTYRALNIRANQLAHFLRLHGVGPGVIVGICIERSLEMVVGILGTLKAGGAYLPIEPSLPQRRIAFMLEDSSASTLLTQKHWQRTLPDFSTTTIYLDSDWEKMAQHSSDNPSPASHLESLVYVIYTSGSTGQPKGVGISHRALNHFLQAVQSKIPISLDDCLLSVTTVSFDMFVQELWWPLMVGAKVALSSKEAAFDEEQLQTLIDESNPTVMQGTPAIWQMLINAGWKGNHWLKVLSGGDTLSHRLVNKLMPGGSDVWNSYGPTEATVYCCCTKVQAGQTNVSIGVPLVNSQLFILDKGASPVPLSTIGELYIGGTSLAHGYLKRPDLTAEKFLPNPWSQIPGARVYKTGDLVRLRGDGHLEFVGRLDSQVKVRGYRIELGEIERTLGRHSQVQQAVVITQGNEVDKKQLVAYMIFVAEEKPTPNELREFLQEHLPEYMIPGLFVPLNSFPLTPHGKVDRQSLPSFQSVPLLATSAYEAPRNQVETTLQMIWSEVLGTQTIGVHDNFFELGGHSLYATQIVSRVRKRLNKELPITQLFLTPTIDKMAKTIMEPSSGDSPFSIPPITPVSRDKLLPLSYSQERIWFTEQLTAGCRAYQFQCAIRFKGNLNVLALELSLNTIVQRHEIFRTTISFSDGAPIQTVHPFHSFDLPVFFLLNSNEEDQETIVHKTIHEEIAKPFNLNQLPLIRWTLLKLGDLDHILLHVEHHMVHDGWSFHVFLRELFEIYSARLLNKLSSLPALPIQFGDFSCWQRKWVESGQLQSQENYWKQQLMGCSSTIALPYDYPRPNRQTFKGAAPRVELPINLAKEIRRWSRRGKTTLFMTLFTGFVGLLYRYTGQHDLSIGTGIANRRLRECEDVIGMIVNNVVLRIRKIQGNLSARDLLDHVRVVTQEAYLHQDLPFDHVVRTVHPDRVPNHNPLFQVMFSCHDTPVPHISLPDLNVSLLEGMSNHTSKFDMNIIVVPWSNKEYTTLPNTGDEGITLIWEYNADLFTPLTITQMIENYHTFLQGMVADPDQFLSELPLLTEPQRAQQIVEWNDTRRNYPRNASISELFEQEVERSPDAIALVFHDRHLSYQALNAQANQLAHYLCRQGVSQEDRVGVCLEQGIDLFVSLLAILKVGAAYVPFDPTYPMERLADMLTDAAVNLMLIHSHHRKTLPGFAGPVEVLDELWTTVAQERTTPIGRHVSSQQLAYIMYTSGTTGKPKGTLIRQRSVIRLVKGAQYATLNARQRFLQAAPIAFDASTFEVWGSLLNGAALIIYPSDPVNYEQLGAILEREQISTVWLTAALFHQMVEYQCVQLSQVEQVLAGGDVLAPKAVQQLLKHMREGTLINGYGPTENTTFTCCHIMTHDSQPEDTVPIGQPITNTQGFVVDQAQQLLPRGAFGELLVGGDGLAWGYSNQAGLTAEKFLPHPWSQKPGARLYRTGDQVRWRNTGILEFLGRRDRQIKLRGYRIELGEIEMAIRDHPAVTETVVICREETPGEKQLIAYLVGSASESDLRSYLQDRLPGYMMPSVFVTLEKFSLTPNGKVNLQALPEPDQTHRVQATVYVAPRTPLEDLLAEIWRDLLKLDRIGVHDNFFELGGHSLLATQLIVRLNQQAQIDFPLRTLFDFPILADQAEAIEDFLIQEITHLTDSELDKHIDTTS